MMVDGFKKAALKLYTLGAADRGWVLDQLPESDRETLLSLMAELKSSGIKPIFLPFDELIGNPSQSKLPPAPEIPEGDDQVLLMTLGPHEVERLVCDEPDWVVSALCNARAWPWRPVLLQRMPNARRREIQESANQANAIKPKVLKAILKASAEKYRAGSRTAGLPIHGRSARPENLIG